MATDLKWDDVPTPPGCRKQSLVFITGGKIIEFAGESIPGVAVVLRKEYEKNGKWSGTYYHLKVGSASRAKSWTSGLKSASPATTWAEMAEWFGVTEESVRDFIRVARPETATRLDLVEAELAGLD